MTATLSAGCQCGLSITVPCPTLGDMDAAHAEMARRGWAWYPGLGNFCSTACAEGAAVELAALQSGRPAVIKKAHVATTRRPTQGEMFALVVTS